MKAKLSLDKRWQNSNIIDTSVSCNVFIVYQKEIENRIEVVFDYDTIEDLIKFSFLTGKLEGVFIGKKMKENEFKKV